MNTNTEAHAGTRQAQRAQGWRTVRNSLVALAISIVVAGWGRHKEIEFQNNPIFNNPFAAPHINTWWVSGKPEYFLAGLIFAGALIGMLVGAYRVVRNPS